MKNYQQQVLDPIEKNKPVTQRLIKAVLGIACESGKLSALVKRLVFESKEIDRGDVLDALGDLLWYMTSAAKAVGKSLDEVAAANIEKLIRQGRIEVPTRAQKP